MKDKYIYIKFSEMMNICRIIKDLDYVCRTMQYPFDSDEEQGKLALLIDTLNALVKRYFNE